MWKLSPSAMASAIAFLMVMATPAIAEERTPLCPPPGYGEPGRALVTTAEAARTIYLAVETDFFLAADREGFPEVVAEDEGDWWSVFRHRPPEPQPNGDVIVTRGGGQLSLRIAKCDAQIAEVSFTR